MFNAYIVLNGSLLIYPVRQKKRPRDEKSHLAIQSERHPCHKVYMLHKDLMAYTQQELQRKVHIFNSY
ncbi:unnamed protein product, partial [Brassica napus]